jgi:outer membrane protein OmpA-like peptidoglycan-associated protein
MSRKMLLRWSIALALMPLPLLAQDGSVNASGNEGNLNLDYTGDRTRIGIGVDDEGEFSGEALKVFGEDEDSAFIAEGWFGSGAGGLKLNYHWLNEGQDKVYKLFGAVDQNDEDDRKATLGAGLERQSYFAGAYYSRALTDERLVGSYSSSSEEILSGTDETGYRKQRQITTFTTHRFAQAYDQGAGLRVGRYWEDSLIRARLGADYEWGDYDADQWTYSLGIEKFIEGSGHSFALNVEHAEKSGEFDGDFSDTRGMLTWRYAFGETYRSRTRSNRVAVTSGADSAAAPRFKVVKHEVKMDFDAYFDLDSAEIRPEHQEDLRKIAQTILNSETLGKISLVGHTCDLASDLYNQGLSERRANAVREQLIANGVPADRIITEGRGESQPMVPNTNEANRSKNRRVDTQFLKLDEEKQALPAMEKRTEWRTETVELPSAWGKRALVNPIAHKRRVDVYHSVTVEESVNIAPMAMNDLLITPYLSAITVDVLANDLDADGDPLMVTAIDGLPIAEIGRYEINADNSITFYPGPEWDRLSISIDYTIDDGRGGSDSAVMTIIDP